MQNKNLCAECRFIRYSNHPVNVIKKHKISNLKTQMKKRNTTKKKVDTDESCTYP